MVKVKKFFGRMVKYIEIKKNEGIKGENDIR